MATVIAAAALAAPADATAQSAEVFAVGAAGGWNRDYGSGGTLFGAAGGGEFLPVPQFGVGGEAAIHGNLRGGMMLALSADGRAHLTRGRDQRVVPFVGGGYSRLMFFELSDHAFNVSGGLDVRVSDRRALRFEFRDFVRDDHILRTHYWAFRAGLTFR
jgi:hypothetical protein